MPYRGKIHITTALQGLTHICIYMAKQSRGDCLKYEMAIAFAHTNLCLGIWACNAVIAHAYTLVYQHDVDSVCLKSKELYRTSVQAKQT